VLRWLVVVEDAELFFDHVMASGDFDAMVAARSNVNASSSAASTKWFMTSHSLAF